MRVLFSTLLVASVSSAAEFKIGLHTFTLPEGLTVELAAGPPLAARKLGEEAVETVVAALSGDAAALTGEAADLLFHLLVLLEARGVPFAKVLAELDRREGMSGITEKAARKP